MSIEQVPDIPMFRQNTAAFVHDLPGEAISNVEGHGNYVRVQVLTNAGALDRDKQLAVVRQFTGRVADAAGDLCRSGHGCCSPKPSMAAGASAVMPIPMPSSSTRRAPRSSCCATKPRRNRDEPEPFLHASASRDGPSRPIGSSALLPMIEVSELGS